MYAVIASGYAAILDTQEEIKKSLAIYPYLKFKYVTTTEQAMIWMRENQRGIYSDRPKNFGTTSSRCYLIVSYYMDGSNIYYNVDLSKFGGFRLIQNEDPNIIINNNINIVNIRVMNTPLDYSVVAHHCIAIRRFMNIIGNVFDVNFLVPNISVYIALTTYDGTNKMIKSTQKGLQERFGVSFSVVDAPGTVK